MKNLLTEKMFRLLDAVTEAPEPVSLQQLVQQSGINCATASRILADLVSAGIVEKASYCTFVPGAGLLRYGDAALLHNPLCREALPILKEKAAELGVSAFLGAWQQEHFFYLYRGKNAPAKTASALYSGLAAAVWALDFAEPIPVKAALQKLVPGLSAAEELFWLDHWEKTRTNGYLELRNGIGFWSICFPFRYKSVICGAAFCGENAAEIPLEKIQFELSLLVSRLSSRLKNSGGERK